MSIGRNALARPSRAADLVAFLRAWAANPLRVAAIAPSGRALANLMTAAISAETGRVLELGPGTGVFTRRLLERGVPEDALTLVEFDPDFAAMLKARFPKARIVVGDAAALDAAGNTLGGPFGAAVSGLPLLSMPAAKVDAILDGVFRHLGPGGSLYQFTYGPRSPVQPAMLAARGLAAARIGHTLRNLPPATVYRYGRRDEGADLL